MSGHMLIQFPFLSMYLFYVRSHLGLEAPKALWTVCLNLSLHLWGASPEVHVSLTRVFLMGMKQRKNVSGSRHSGNCQRKLFRGQRVTILLSERALKKSPPWGMIQHIPAFKLVQMLPWGSVWGSIISATTYEDFFLEQQSVLLLADTARE